MATSETPRFGLPQWSEDTDPIARSQFDDAFAAIDSQAANKPNLATGDPSADAFQISEADGNIYLQFSDGENWYNATNGAYGEAQPLNVTDGGTGAPILLFYSEEDDDWFPANDPTAVPLSVADGGSGTPSLTFFSTDDNDWFPTKDTRLDIIANPLPELFFEFEGEWYSATNPDPEADEWLSEPAPEDTLEDVTNNTESTARFKIANTTGGKVLLWRTGTNWKLAGADVRVSSTEPTDPLEGTIWVEE